MLAMDEETRKLLEENLKLTKENHVMLKKIRGTQKTAQMLRALYWVFIIALAFGSFYFIQPYIKSLTKAYSDLGVNVNGLKNFGSSFDLNQVKEFINQNNQAPK